MSDLFTFLAPDVPSPDAGLETPWTAELNGLAMGAGTSLQFAEDGWEGFGVLASRGSRSNRPRQHGTRPIPQYMPERLLRFTLEALADSSEHAEELLLDVGAAFAPDTAGLETLLLVRFGGPTTYVLVGQPQRTEPALKRLPRSSPAVACEFAATDPVAYSAVLEDAGAFLGTTEGGLELPHDFPHGFGSATAGSTNVNNLGNVPVPWVANIHAGIGGLTNPRLTLASTGEALEYIGTVAEGDFLELNSRDRTVLLNGTADRSNLLNRPTRASWFDLPVGADTVTFTGEGLGGLLILNYRHGYLF